MMPNSRIAASTIFELLKENHHEEVEGGIKLFPPPPPPPPRLELKAEKSQSQQLLCQKLFIRFGFSGYKPSSAIVKFSFETLIVTIVDV